MRKQLMVFAAVMAMAAPASAEKLKFAIVNYAKTIVPQNQCHYGEVMTGASAPYKINPKSETWHMNITCVVAGAVGSATDSRVITIEFSIISQTPVVPPAPPPTQPKPGLDCSTWKHPATGVQFVLSIDGTGCVPPDHPNARK